MRRGRGRLQLALAIAFFLVPCGAQSADETAFDESDNEKLLLDHLMTAESGGRQFAKNPLSSARGPFQFLEGTFLDVMRRKLPALTVGKSDAEISKLRVEPKISRTAALIYIRESAKFFAARNVPAAAVNLRLAFFVGQTGALRVLAAKSDKPLSEILSASVIAANPRLSVLTAAQLIEKSSQEAQGIGTATPAPPIATLTAGQAIAASSRHADGFGAAALAPELGPLAWGQPMAAASGEADSARTVVANAHPNVIADYPHFEPNNEAAVGTVVSLPQAAAASDIVVRCNLKLASCKKWLALAEKRSHIAQAAVSHQ